MGMAMQSASEVTAMASLPGVASLPSLAYNMLHFIGAFLT